MAGGGTINVVDVYITHSTYRKAQQLSDIESVRVVSKNINNYTNDNMIANMVRTMKKNSVDGTAIHVAPV